MRYYIIAMQFLLDMMRKMQEGTTATGPLSKAIIDADADPSTRFGNNLIFSFAGHDTTGHTMTW